MKILITICLIVSLLSISLSFEILSRHNKLIDGINANTVIDNQNLHYQISVNNMFRDEIDRIEFNCKPLNN